MRNLTFPFHMLEACKEYPRYDILPLSAATPPAPAFHWLRAVEYLRCYPRVLNIGCLSSNILYLQRSKYQIQTKEVRQPLSHPCSHVVFQEIFVTEATQGLSQKSKTAWINNQAHTKACTLTPWICRIIYYAAVVTLWS